MRNKMETIAIKGIFGGVFGGIAGYLYYRTIGCSSGACPLTSNPYTSTLYGVFTGFYIASM